MPGIADNRTARLATWLLAVICLSILGLSLAQLRTDYLEQVRKRDADVNNLSSTLLQDVEAAIWHASSILQGLADRYQSEGSPPETLQRIRQLAIRQKAIYPAIEGIFLIAADGRPLLSTLPAAPAGNYADREYFRFHQQHDQPDLHIGTPIRSRSTGNWIITLTLRVNDLAGQFAGVALATLSVQNFLHFYSTLDLGPQGTVHLARSDGLILIRYPFPGEQAYRQTTNGPVLQLIRQGQTKGVLTFNSVVDGIRRIFGYEVSQRLPIYVLVGEEEQQAFAAWRQSLYTTLAITLVTLGIVMGVGLKAIRSIRRHQQVARQLRETHATLSRINRELQQEASEDSLTGLANRRQMDRALDHYLLEAELEQYPLSFILLDIDHFKVYNDTYGHPAGDQCLRQISACIREQIRSHTDIPARYGGEELAVILPHTPLMGARIVAEKIRLAIFDAAIPLPETAWQRVTVSLGVAACHPDRQLLGPEQLIQQADQALYRAKQSGRNRVVCAPLA